MRLAIIGAGDVARAVAKLLQTAGHEIYFGSREPGRKTSLEGVATGSIEAAIEFGEVVFCAVPFGAWPDLARRVKNRVAGKVVIDAANPDRRRDGEMAAAALRRRGGAGEFVAKLIPGALLVRTFSTIQASRLALGEIDGEPRLGLPLAADHQAAVHMSAQLVKDAGFDPVVLPRLVEARRFDSDSEVFNSAMTGPDIAATLNFSRAGRFLPALAPLIGDWTLEMTTHSASGLNHSSSLTACKCWLGDGRYVEEAIEGEFAGSRHEKRTLLGFNATRGRFEYVTADNHDAVILHFTSVPSVDLNAQAIDLWTEYVSPGDAAARGVLLHVRTKIQIHNDDAHTLTNYYSEPGGPERLFLEYRYWRKS